MEYIFSDGPLDVTNEFELLNVIGKGQFGEVWKAIHKKSQKTIALKKQFLKEDNAQLIREVKIMESMKSPYIVGYYGSTLINDIMWIVMEFCCYGSINDMMVLTKKTFNENQIATLCQAILEGIVYMMRVQKIHRDIKPHNVLLNEKGEAKLCDFGISAEFIPGQKRKTVIGTPYYLAPEVIQESGYDHKSDIWALGISAIEMAEFHPPLHDSHPMRVLFMIPTSPSPTLTNPEHWSSEFNDFLSVCLQKEPDRRRSPIDLLRHDFLKKKCSIPSLLPYMRNVDNIIELHGGLDEALKAVHLRGNNDFDESDSYCDLQGFNEKEMFGELSDDSLGFRSDDEDPFEDDMSSASIVFTASEDEDSDSLNFSTSRSRSNSDVSPSSEESDSEKLEELDVNDLVRAKPKHIPSLKIPSTLSMQFSDEESSSPTPKRTDESVFTIVVGNDIVMNIPKTSPKTEDSYRFKPTPRALKTARALKTSRRPKIAKLVENQSAHEAFSDNRIYIDKLISSENEGMQKLKGMVHTYSESIEPITSSEMKKDREATIEDYINYYTDYQKVYVSNTWRGIGLARNPWRNNPQYKVTISQSTILCVVVETFYHGKSSVALDHFNVLKGHIGLTVFSVVDTSKQVLIRPRSTHILHKWESNDVDKRVVQIYLENPSHKYIFVPTVTVLGDAEVDYKFQILYPPDIEVTLESIPIMPTVSVKGEWTEATAGGTLDGIEWRKNPQYVMEVTEPTTVQLFLAQESEKLSNIGFYVITVDKKPRKKLISVDYENVVVKEQTWRKAPEVSSVKPLTLDVGYYIILPCTFYPRNLGKFILTAASSNININITELVSNYHEACIKSKWVPFLDGGCTQNPNWFDNPRFHLETTTDKPIHFFIDCKPWAKKQKEFVGMYIFKAEPHQYLSLSKNQLVAKTKQFSDDKEVPFVAKKLKKGSYIVLVTTFEPGRFGKFILRAFCSSPFTLKSLELPPIVSIGDSWTTENTGGAFNFGLWRKNPQFYIRLARSPDTNLPPSAKVEIVLTQEPRQPTEAELKKSPRPEEELMNRPYYPYVGFYAFKAPSGGRAEKLMKITKGDVLKITEFQSEPRIVWTTKITSGFAITIMPTPFEPSTCNNFVLSIAGVSRNDVIFKKIKDRNKMYTHTSSWSIANGTAGGCTNFSKGGNEQWLDNPQILIVSQYNCEITIVLKQDLQPKDPIAAGIYLLSKKKGIKLSKRSIRAKSEFMASCEVVLSHDLLAGEAYVILLSSFNVGEENKMAVDVYASKELQWRPIK